MTRATPRAFPTRVDLAIVALALAFTLGVAHAQSGLSSVSPVGFVQVIASGGVEVYLDGSLVGVTDDEQGGLILTDVAIGQRELRFVDGRFEQRVHVTVETGSVRVVEVRDLRPTVAVYEEGDRGTPEPATPIGSITIQCLPVECTIDARALGIEGYTKERDRLIIDGVPEGTYEIRVSVRDRSVRFDANVCGNATVHAFANFATTPPSVSVDGDADWPVCLREARPTPVSSERVTPTTPSAPERAAPPAPAPAPPRVEPRSPERDAVEAAPVAPAPELSIEPRSIGTEPGVPVAFRAVSSDIAVGDLRWVVSAGGVQPLGDRAVFDTPHQPGLYLVTVYSRADRRAVATARVDVRATEGAAPSAPAPAAPAPSVTPSERERDADDAGRAPTAPSAPEQERVEAPPAAAPAPAESAPAAPEAAAAAPTPSSPLVSVAQDVSFISLERPRLGPIEDGARLLSVDVAWDGSWRGPDRLSWVEADDNWDAAWLFVKYRNGPGQPWQHARLASGGHLAPSGASVDVPSDGMGAFVYRSASGSGAFDVRNVGLNLDASGSQGNASEYRVYALEMVFVPEGAFFLGDGSDAPGVFRAGGDAGGPFLVNAAGPIELGSGDGQLTWEASQTSGRASGRTAEGFPTGFEAFYVMKHPVTQGAYAAFLNALAERAASERHATNGAANARYTITRTDDGSFSAREPFVPANFLSWVDAAAFASWAGLRPITELEYEKAARGPAEPLAGAYAWGDAGLVTVERVEPRSARFEQVFPVDANVVAEQALSGPIVVGSVATGSGLDRVQAGASYWGVLELSGNVWERVISVGSDAGRSFTGAHGDASAASVSAPLDGWPAAAGDGTGFRGGSWISDAAFLRVSDRAFAGFANPGRDSSIGFRAGRGVP